MEFEQKDQKLWFTDKERDSKFTLKGNSAGDLRIISELTPKGIIENLKLKVDCTCNSVSITSSVIASADYTIPDLSKIKISINDQYDFKAQTTIAKDGVGLGFDFGYNCQSHQITAQNCAVFWLKDASELVLKHNTKTFSLG